MVCIERTPLFNFTEADMTCDEFVAVIGQIQMIIHVEWGNITKS